MGELTEFNPKWCERHQTVENPMHIREDTMLDLIVANLHQTDEERYEIMQETYYKKFLERCLRKVVRQYNSHVEGDSIIYYIPRHIPEHNKYFDAEDCTQVIVWV